MLLEDAASVCVCVLGACVCGGGVFVVGGCVHACAVWVWGG